jgi:hypothetical protein
MSDPHAGTSSDANAPASRRHILRLLVQLAGLLAGVASLWWCVSQALLPENREQIGRLLHAPAHLLLAMFALSLATIVINGLLFWVMLAPVRRLRVADTVAVNGLCQMVSYLPLKLGAVTRILVHNRRDRVPLPTIGAWFAAMLVPWGAAYAPPLVALLLTRRLNLAWGGLTLGGECASVALVVWLARCFRGVKGLERLGRLAARVPLLPLGRFLRTKLWGDLHAGFDMLSSPGAVAGSAALRLVDLSIHTARFMVAGAILGSVLPLERALPISVVYFVMGVISPSGQAGLREGAATGFAALLLTQEDASGFSPKALLVSATEAPVFLAAGLLGLLWLRPDRLIRASRAQSAAAPGAALPERAPGA